MTSMLPVVTYNIWGRTRGAEVYGYMYAEFGFAAMYGLVLVKLLQHRIGYTGMILVCLGMTTCITATLTYFYKFDTPFKYKKQLN